jgi:predicted PurR-regulated permease PerM
MQSGSGRWLALIIALGIALYLCWSMIEPFLNVLLWAVVLVVIFYPIHIRLLARLRSPTVTAGVSTLLVVVTILVPTTLITIAVLGELGRLSGSVSSGALQQAVDSSPLAQRVLHWLSPYVDVNELRSPDQMLERLEGWSGAIANRTLGVVGGVLSAVVQTFLVIFTMFYLFRDAKAIRTAAYDLLPLEPSQTHDVIARTRDVIGAAVYGVIVIAAVQGLLGGFIFWALGLPSALLWAVVMFFLSMIPMAGAFLVWAPAALFLAFSGAWAKAIFLTAWGVLVVGSIDNFLSPRLVGKRAALHELLIFFSVLGGIQLFGVVGVVLGPVVVALTLAILDVVRQANRPPSETKREESIIERQQEIRQTS